MIKTYLGWKLYAPHWREDGRIHINFFRTLAQAKIFQESCFDNIEIKKSEDYGGGNMNTQERHEFESQTHQNESLEQGFYFSTVATFCTFLNEAYQEGEEGRKFEMLKETMEKHLDPECFEEFFGGF